MAAVTRRHEHPAGDVLVLESADLAGVVEVRSPLGSYRVRPLGSFGLPRASVAGTGVADLEFRCRRYGLPAPFRSIEVSLGGAHLGLLRRAGYSTMLFEATDGSVTRIGYSMHLSALTPEVALVCAALHASRIDERLLTVLERLIDRL